MERWLKHKGAGLAIRTGGLALLLASWGVGIGIGRLIGGDPADAPTAIELLAAMTLFGAASLGSAMLLLGRHLWDHVVVADQWTSRSIRM
jgi:predicted MFS family arabinose efflux permease